MLKRADGISFPGYYAFPGGNIERQDYVHKWQTNMPHYHDEYLRGGIDRIPDFTKKMAALRELFEECNVLVAKSNSGT